MPWQALKVRVQAGEAEALSEALLEAGAESVSLEGLDAPRATVCALLARGRDAGEVLRQAAAAAGVGAIPFTTGEVADEDWVRVSQTQFAPIEVGARLWVGPSWHEPAPGRIAVRLDPGLAFGTGAHPSTRLALEFLEHHVGGGERILDYGCGSGILAIAAAKLGAAEVTAVDVDPQAVATTKANARVNGVELRACLPEGTPRALYDIVVSNILAQPLIMLAPLLAARTAPGGRIALSGILASQAADVTAVYAQWFDTHGAAAQGWALVCGVRRR